MSMPEDRLYELLPAFHRIRDDAQGEPLRALLQVIADQVNLVEKDIEQLYDNWFIETCQDWVVPYIGDLIGYTSLFETSELDAQAPQEQTRNKILIPRSEVANTIRYRRRKGTLSLLELLADDVADWPARAVEFYTLLGWTQHLNHQQPQRGRTADLRDGQALDLHGGAFESLAHTVDVRRITSERTPGRHNIPSVGLFVWRLGSYSVTHTEAYCLEEAGLHCYTFSALGNDTQLYIKPQRESSPTQIAGELNVPAPIRRRALADSLQECLRGVDGDTEPQINSSYYGDGKSLAIYAANWPGKNPFGLVPPECITIADLSDWVYRPTKGRIAVDPVLGRIAFPPNQCPKGDVRVSYQYAFSAKMGGGEYPRALLPQPHENVVTYRVGKGKESYGTVDAALRQWRDEEQLHAVIEIMDSRVYDLAEVLEFCKPNQHLTLRAASGARPILRLLDRHLARPDAFTIWLQPSCRLVLDGLLITGRGVRVENVPTEPASSRYESEDLQNQKGDEISKQSHTMRLPPIPCESANGKAPTVPPPYLRIRHCTLVPGWSLDSACKAKRPAEASLVLCDVDACVLIEASILGSIEVLREDPGAEPMALHLRDSILDATSAGKYETYCAALSAPNNQHAAAVLTVQDSTVLGDVLTHAIDLGENTIFDGAVRVARSQRGCLRFCYVGAGSRTPRRYNCQPDLVEQSAPTVAQAEQERQRVRPRFNSRAYGTPTYCQLADDCADKITQGADDQSEMGAFHDLYQPQRMANLRARLDEFTPAGSNAGIIFAS